MKKPSIVTIIAIVGATMSPMVEAQNKMERKPLLKAEIGAQTITTVDVREITFQPLQQTGRHRHPCPVISYIVAGTITFQIQG